MSDKKHKQPLNFLSSAQNVLHSFVKKKKPSFIYHFRIDMHNFGLSYLLLVNLHAVRKGHNTSLMIINSTK